MAARAAARAVSQACRRGAFHSRLEGPHAHAPRVPVMFGSGPCGPDSIPGWSGEVLEAMGAPPLHVSTSHTAHVSLVYYLGEKITTIGKFRQSR